MNFASRAAAEMTAAGWVQEPPEESPVLSRPRLLDRVSDGLVGGAVTLLSAPAGFGKTVLLRQLVAATESCMGDIQPPPNGGRERLSLAGADPIAEVAPRRPLHQALTSAPKHGAPAGTPVEGMTTIIWRGGMVVVVDCCDGYDEEGMAEQLDAGVLPWPVTARAIVAGRPGGPLLECLQRIGGIDIIDESELRFTSTEAERLVRQMSGRELTVDQVRALMRRTAGWPLAVKVLAMAMRGTGDTDAVIAGLRGTDARLSAFVRHEVLDRLPAEMRRFLVRTSVLDRLDGRLCRVVEPTLDTEAMLRRLREQRMFVRPDTVRPGSLRYVELFREALRGELERSRPGSAPLLAALADWYDREGVPEQAAPILVETERWDDLLDLIDRHTRMLADPARLDRSLEWLDAVPASTQARRRAVGLRRAFVLTLLGQRGRAAQVLRPLEGLGLTPAELALADVIRAMWVHAGASPTHAVRAARSALLALGTDRVGPSPLGMASTQDMAALAGLALGRGLWFLSAVTDARATLAALVDPADQPAPVRDRALGALALLDAWAGELSAAGSHAEAVLSPPDTVPGRDGPAAADALLALAHVQRERGDLSGARSHLVRAAEAIGRTSGSPVAAVEATETALWHLAAGEPDAGLAVLSEYDATGAAPAPAIVEDRLRAAEVRLRLSLGDIRGAEGVIGATAPGPALRAASVQAALARRDMASAQHRLERWTDSGPTVREHLERDLWTAIVELESGRRRQALRQAVRLVDESAAEGHRRLFLDGGPAARRLLRALVRAAPNPYVTRLVDETTEAAPIADPLVHGLSRREQEIIRYLPTPLSSAQIAAQLYISVNTLKTHLRTIYRKLGVTGRRQASSRAQELGLA